MNGSAELRRVLIVDDDPALLDALSEALAIRMGFVRSDTCESGAAALRKIASEDYDAIISDVKMPGMDGLELLARVREVSPEVPVLLITGHGETDIAISALRAGAYDLIQKPLDRDYLVAALSRAIEARRLRRHVEESRAALQRHAVELEQRIEERTRELVQANRAKDEFLGLVSHELRTPITVILGNADLLQRRGDRLGPEMRARALADLRLEAQRLQRVIENLLVLARLEYGQRVESEPVLLRHLILEQMDAHRQAYPDRPLRLTPDDRDLPVVLAEPTHVELVLRNLLNNAEKYSRPATEIDVVLHIQPEELQISVLDRGEGIRPEEAEEIFAPFYRSPSLSSTALGMGIGLAVCKRLVEANKGRVWARPREGGGSEFGFSLPILGPTGREDDSQPEAAAAALP
jgi:two-component system, sensor histidine kinase and response regulator